MKDASDDRKREREKKKKTNIIPRIFIRMNRVGIIPVPGMMIKSTQAILSFYIYHSKYYLLVRHI